MSLSVPPAAPKNSDSASSARWSLDPCIDTILAFCDDFGLIDWITTDEGEIMFVPKGCICHTT